MAFAPIAEDFYVERAKRRHSFDMASSHYHEQYEIYYLLSGNRRYFIGHTVYDVKKGDIVMIPKGTIHKTVSGSDSGHERYLIYFTDCFAAKLYEAFGKAEILSCFQSPVMTIPAMRRENLLSLLDKMEEECRNKDHYRSFLLESYTGELLILLNRYAQKQKSLTVAIPVYEEKIQQAAQYVCQSFGQELSLDAVAEQAHMSRSYFSRQFKQVTGFGFNEYLNLVRLKEAETLLLTTKRQITEIAFSCGYQNSNYFTDLFKKKNGVSPQAYRKQKTVL